MNDKNIAIIDIGSNSVRLAMFSDGKIFYKTSATTQLGKDRKNNMLSLQSICRTFQGVDMLMEKAKELGGEKYFAYATAAVRNSLNGEDFCNLFKDKYNIDVDVLTGEQEAEAGLFGALGNLDGTVIDVGGGSTEVVTRVNGTISYMHSLQEGAVSVTSECQRDYERAKSFLKDKIEIFKNVPLGNNIVGIGGTCNTLAFMMSGLSEYDGEKQDKRLLKRERLNEFVHEFYSSSSEDLQKKYHIDKLRSQVIHSGAVILLSLLNVLDVNKITLRECDNLEGYYKLKVEKKL